MGGAKGEKSGCPVGEKTLELRVSVNCAVG